MLFGYKHENQVKISFLIILLLHTPVPFTIGQEIVTRNQYLPRWSPDGKKYACIEVGMTDGSLRQWLTIYDETNQNQLVSIELNGLGQIAAELFPPNALTGAEAQLGLLPALAGFSWASDSEHYVFINGKLSSESLFQKVKRYDLDLYIGNLKREITQLTSDSVAELCPIWSPDGQFIAYTHSGKIRIQRLLAYPSGAIETSIAPPFSIITEGEAIAMFPEWNLNSDKIAFSVYQHNDFDLFIYDLASDKPTRLTQTPHIREYHPVWSPDSEFLAFYSLQPKSQNSFSISIAKADIISPIMDSISMDRLSEAATIDGYELQIANDVRPNVLLGPSWMASGRHIVYVKDSDNYPIEVVKFDLIDKKLQQITETGTIMNSDIQCAKNEAKLIFSRYIAGGGGVSFSNVKVHILPQVEFTPPTIPIEMVVFNQDNVPIEGAKIYINDQAFDKKTDREGKAIGWLRKTPDSSKNPNRYGINEISLDLPGRIRYRISPFESSENVTIQPLNNKEGKLAKLFILAKVRMDNVILKPISIEFQIKDSAYNKPAADVTIAYEGKIIGRTNSIGIFSYSLILPPEHQARFGFSKSGWYQDQYKTITISKYRSSYVEWVNMQPITKKILLDIVDEAEKPIQNPDVRLTSRGVSITNTDKRAIGKIILTTELPPQTVINGDIFKRGYVPEKLSFYVPEAPSIQIREVLQREKRAGWGLWGQYSTPNFIDALSSATEIDDGFAAAALRRERSYLRTVQFGFSQMKLEKSMPGGRRLSTMLRRLYLTLGLVKVWRIELSGESGLLIVQDRFTSRQGVITSPKLSYTTFDEFKDSINGIMGGGTVKLFLPGSIVLYGSARYLQMENIDLNASMSAKDYITQKRFGGEYEGGIRILLPYLPLGLEAAYMRVDLKDLHAGNIRAGVGLVY